MKINLTIISCLVLLSACTKNFLEVDPSNGTIQSAQYFNTVAECETSTLVSYRYVDHNDWWQTQWFRMVGGEAASDNMWIGLSGGQATARQAAHYELNPENDRIEAHWIMSYKSIFQYNSVIDGISKSPIDNTLKEKFIAELKFLRAFHYFEMVRMWGDIPYLTEILAPGEATYSKSTVKEILDNTTADLLESIAVLPLKSEYSAKDKGRASKGAAQSLLAKIYLFREQWADAERLAAEVVNSGVYRLEPNFGDIHRTNNYNGPESIFEIQYQFTPTYPALGNRFIQTASSLADGGWGYFNPTSDLENAYISEKDSIRRVWTILKHGTPVAGDPATPVYNADRNRAKSARFSRKHYVPKALRSANPARQDKNNIYLRLGDIILVHAEAAAMQNKSAVALESLKKIRDRVSLETDMTLTGQNLINAVRKERRLETALEGERLFDLRRWKDASGAPVINSVLGPDGSFVRYNTVISTDTFEKANTFEAQNKGALFVAGKHNLWPIPTKEVTGSEGRITQNPGYN